MVIMEVLIFLLQEFICMGSPKKDRRLLLLIFENIFIPFSKVIEYGWVLNSGIELNFNLKLKKIYIFFF